MEQQPGEGSRNGHFQDAAMRARAVFGMQGDLTNIVSSAENDRLSAETRTAQISKLKSTYRTG